MSKNAVNKSKEGKSVGERILSEAFLLAVLTASGYLAAYAYQWSYLKYFGIPAYMVDVSLGLVLLTTLVALVWALSLMSLLYTLARWEPGNKFTHTLRWVLFALFLLGAFFPIYSSIGPMIGFASIIAILFVSVFWYKKIDVMPEEDEKSIYSKLEKKFGVALVTLASLLLVFICYSSMMGTTIAKTQKNYLIQDSDPRLAVISTFQDSFIAVGLSTTTPGTFTKNLTLIGKDNIQLTNAKTGPLSLESAE